MCAKGLKLVSRHRAFVKVLNEEGLAEARRILGYCDSSVRRLMADERTWEYLVIIRDEMASRLGLSMDGLFLY